MRGNCMFSIHAIWKYANFTLVSLLSKCIWDHSLDIWPSRGTAYLLAWICKCGLLKCQPPCEKKHPSYPSVLRQETETHSVAFCGWQSFMISLWSGSGKKRKDSLLEINTSALHYHYGLEQKKQMPHSCHTTNVYKCMCYFYTNEFITPIICFILIALCLSN